MRTEARRRRAEVSGKPAGHVGERPDVADAAQLPHVVQVQQCRTEQEVGVEVVVADEAADKREPVRVQAARRSPSTASPGLQREPSTRSALATSPTIVPAKSSSSSR